MRHKTIDKSTTDELKVIILELKNNKDL